jgi:2-keto-4-pentenoate hydratase/2-oxohepta-3-ene-1,7-dioic acid hydratase in catechol pathway
MRLLRVGPKGQERPCVAVADERVLDLSSWVNDWSGRALDPAFLVAIGERLSCEAHSLPIADLGLERIGPPVKPGQIISIGLNYRKHAEEAGMPLPTEPIVASKSISAIAGPNDDLIIPPQSEKTDWEVELGVIIGRRAQYLGDPGVASEYVTGYCTANDVSERAWLLERGGQWIKGKSFESFGPLGPYLVTKEEISEPGNLTLTCRVNGRLLQNDSTADLIFGVDYLIYYLSQFMILEPGDVIITGSPAGMALGRPNQPYLRHGDIVEAEVSGLGAQRQRCRNYVCADAQGAAVGTR